MPVLFLSAVVAARVSAWAVALAAVGVSQQPGAPLPDSTLPLRLTGLMLDADAPARSACLVGCASSPERHALLVAGDRACEVAKILEVRQDGVVVENLKTGRMELLAFPAATGSLAARQAPRPGVAPAARADEGSPDVPEVPVGRYLANLPELLESALATPRYRDGGDGQRVMDGFEIGQVKAGGAAAQLGLRNGDVIQEVDGQSLDGMATVMRLFGQVQTLPRVKVTILRDGRRLTFVLTTK